MGSDGPGAFRVAGANWVPLSLGKTSGAATVGTVGN